MARKVFDLEKKQRLSELLNKEHSQVEIAKILGFSKSCVHYEISRGGGRGNYDPFHKNVLGRVVLMPKEYKEKKKEVFFDSEGMQDLKKEIECVKQLVKLCVDLIEKLYDQKGDK